MKYLLDIYNYIFLPISKFYSQTKGSILKYPVSKNGFEAIPRNKMVRYNKVRQHGAKKLFCYNPFVHMFFNISGDVIACCRSHDNILGKYPEKSIKEIWFGKKYKKLREHMRHNDLNMGCDYCKVQIKSNRFQDLPSVNPDKYATDKINIYPRTMELELSNKCNLQCVMCSGRVSSAIRLQREKLPPIESPYDDNFVEQLKEFMPHLKEIHFCGGEPFLIDIYYKIWEQVIKINPKIRLFAVTNGTVFNKQIENILQSTRFNIIISLDSLNKERYEYIRKGANFETVMENIEKFHRILGNVTISHTPMQINWDDTPEIINFCNRINAQIHFSHIEDPVKYALWSLPPEKLDSIYNYYNNLKWENTNHKLTAKYNFTIFNEWKEQIKYFRDKNQKIFDKFSNDKLKINSEILVKKFEKLLSGLPYDNIGIDKTLEILNSEILSKPASPIKVEAMENLIYFLDDKETINSEYTRSVFQSSEKLRQILSRQIDEDNFWKKFY
ncbi:MAG: twitch domain-containing radical SAM protein [Bacteroidota bacterium]